MKTRQKLLSVFSILILTILACNLPSQPVAAPPDGSAATVTVLAATIQAQNNPPAANVPLTEIPFPTTTPTITLTPTLTIPMVKVSENTNCRTGPSMEYDLIGALLVGGTAEVVGKYTTGNYWIIKNPGSSGNCWLWGKYASVSGNTANLPEYPVPSTPTPSHPATPGDLAASVSCSPPSSGGGPFLLILAYDVHVELTWTDVATNETGYYVNRDGTLIATLGANTTNYSDNTSLPSIFKAGEPPPNVKYSVQAYNKAGTSGEIKTKVVCP